MQHLRNRSQPLLALAVAVLLAEPCASAADVVETSGSVRLEKTEPWAPHPRVAPRGKQSPEGEVILEANGTRTCCGGWQFVYQGVRPGQAYRLKARVKCTKVRHPSDSLLAMVLWDQWKPEQIETGNRPWNYLLPKSLSEKGMEFESVVRAPEGVSCLTVRYAFRWSEEGSSRWTPPAIEPATLPEKKPVKVCIVNAPRQAARRIKIEPLSQGLDLPKDVAETVDLWGSLVLAACRRQPQLIVTPEVVIGGKDMLNGSIVVPGPATQPFQQIAKQHKVHVVLGLKERTDDAFYNSAVLVGPEGSVLGVYRKIHLATSEGLSGLSPGDRFPVFNTGIGRIGCLICMDTTVCESPRMLALNGAEFICFPIMGDLRADRWSPGSPIFNESRWKAIMRTRAIDNQVCMVVARNSVQGSCVIDRKGDFLAWNEGDQEVIEATVPPEDGYRVWNGGDFREVTFLLRRPHLYGDYSDGLRLGPLGEPARRDPPR